MIQPDEITHKTVQEVFREALGRRAGRGPGKIALTDLSDATTIETRTIKAWRDGETMPQLHNLLRLCAYFGPAFASEILSPAGLGGVEDIETTAIDAPTTAADLVKTAHDLLERLRDGVFCHRDKAACGPILLSLSRQLEAQGRAMMGGKGGTA